MSAIVHEEFLTRLEAEPDPDAAPTSPPIEALVDELTHAVARSRYNRSSQSTGHSIEYSV